MTIDFNTSIADKVAIYGINEYLRLSKLIDVTTTATATIHYTMEPDIKNLGLKGIDIFFNSVVVSVEWEVAPDELTESDVKAILAAGGNLLRNGSYSGSIVIDNKTFEVKSEVDFYPDGGFIINDVEVWMNKKEIIIN